MPKPLYTSTFNQSEIQIHHLSQFLAVTAKHFLEEKANDSHTNAGWENHYITSRLIQNLQLKVNVPEFQLEIWANRTLEKPLEADGKSKSELFEALKEELNHLGLDTSTFENKLHYELPEHALDKGAAFAKPKAKDLQAWINLRDLAQQCMIKLNAAFNNSSEIRIWPHHFDTGVYFELNTEGTKSIGAGLAIGDSMIAGPYFYIYGWQKDQEIDFATKPGLKNGRWIIENWKGAVLPADDLNQLDKPLETANDFFEQIANWYRSILNS